MKGVLVILRKNVMKTVTLSENDEAKAESFESNGYNYGEVKYR